MATGGEIVLDEKFISLLAQADKNIKAITGSTESAEKSMVKWLSKLNSMGLDSFTKHLENIRDKYLSMSTALEKNNAFKTLASNCLNAADATQKLIDNLSKANGTNVNNSFKQTANSVKDLNTALASPAKSAGGFSSIEQEMKKTMDRIILLKNEITTFKQLEGNNKNILNTSDYANIGKVSDELTRLMSKYETLDGTLKRLKSQDVFKTHMDNLNGTSLAAQKQKSELNKLNEAYRNGTSELQKKAKIEDAAAQKELANTKIREQAQKRLADSKTLADRALNYTKGMYSPQGVLSINNMQKALSRLQEAQQRLNLNTAEGRKKYDELGQQIKRVEKDLKNATKGVGGFKRESDKLGRVFGQLKTQLTALFGVAAIKGYIQKLVDVRREFERQQKALEGILQSKDEADKLWSQTTQLALKSPFSVRELITYTKQLSAYRIETDKLHDTTKRLADVSAGIGVDMSRLILAYGQVRAAEYLRGTELRQFTEAGIPMLDELARYFTELEGRAYTTAEVFDMISKRMVEFEDVEAVIHRMTDEGGIFFEMQEQQSKTLHGELSNLKDAYELMLNSIGESNEGIIKSAISDLRELVKNWRVVVSTIEALKPLLYTLGSGFLLAQVASTKFAHSLVALGTNYKVLSGWNMAWNRWLIATTRNSKAAGLGIRLLGGAIRGLAATGVMAAIGLLITGIVKLAYNIAQAGARAKELRESFSSIDVEISGELDKGIESYKELVAQIKDVTLSYGEREKAMQRLKRQFQDILPDQYLELEYIEKTTDAYSEATDALRNYYNAKAKEQKETKLNDIFGEDILKESSNFNKYANTFATRLGISSKSVRSVLDKTIEEVKKGTIEADNLYKEFLERLQTYSGKTISTVDYKTFYEGNVKTVKALIDVLKDYERYRGDISGLSFETKVEEDRFYAKQKANEQLEEEKTIIKDLTTAYSNYYKAKEKQNKNGTTPELGKAIEGFKGDIKTNYEKLKIDFPIDDFFNITANQHEITNEIEKITKQIYNRFQKQIEEESKTNPLLDNFSEDLANAIEDLDSNKDIKETTEQLFKALSNQFSIPMSMFDKFEAKSDSTVESVRKKMEDELELIKKNLESYYNALDTMPKMKTLEWQEDWVKRTTGLTTEKVKVLETFVEVLTLGIQALGGAIEKTTSSSNNKSQKDYYSDVLKILQDTHKEYKDLTNTLSHVDAKQLALDKHTRAFAEAVKNIPSLAKFKLEDFAFDKEDGAIEMLEKLKSLIPTTAKNYKSLMVDIEQAIGDIRGEAIIEAKVKADEDLANEIEEMFDGYELSLELDKLGLPKNFMSDLFHIDIFNLDQIRDKIEGEIDKIESGKGEKDNLKKLQDFLKKVDDMEEKQMQERLKKYSKYLLKSQSEAVKIKLEELRQLEEIESLSDVSNAQKSVMKQGVRDEAQKKLDKATWDTFKDSDMYIRMFEDLESQSTKSIQRMREELSKYRDSLKSLDDPTALKEIGSRIDALDEQIAKRNPFKGLSEAYKNYREVIKEYGSRNDLEDSLAINRDKERTLTKRVDDQQIKVDTERKALNDALLKGNVLEISARKQSLATEEETLDVMVKQLATQKGITEEEARKLLKLDNARKMFTGSLADIGTDISNITSAFPTIMSDLESMGVSISDSTRDTVESVAEIGSGIGNAIQGIASDNIVQVITGVTSALAGIAKIGDKKKERQIQREIKLVEELGRQYEKLQDKIEKAYSLDTFRASYNATQANLEKQIEAYDRMIAAEEDKKNTDRERIKEWKQAQEDLRKQQQELRDQQLQELGGFGESGYKDAAQQFVDAWVDAFKETGDGLSGLEDKWDEYLQNIIRKQMALKISDKLVQPLLSELDKALENDSYLSTDEMKKITALSEELFPQISESLQKLAEMYGSDWLKTDGGLSGLTQGIQGITEQTADQLAGLVNSIRLYVANNNTELIRIASALGASTQVENPMVSQLKIIASHTNNISTILESVVTSSTLGRGIRVITEI